MIDPPGPGTSWWQAAIMSSLRQSPRTVPSVLALALALAGCDSDKGPSDELAGDGDGDENAELGEDPPSDAPVEELPEPCDIWGESRACGDGGTQFCYSEVVDQVTNLYWGECLTSYDCAPGQTLSCGEQAGDRMCTLDGAGIPFWPDCEPTPLLLRFEPGPFELAASTAIFDVAGTGECLATDWPAAQNPWLAIDLDRNGFIDAGHELFGSGTVLPSGVHARNGFVALAQLDQNHDGRIDGADPRFAEILVWRDEDADKRSTPWELTSLADEGVASIELDFVVAEQCDARGNCARERSRFEFVSAGQPRVGEVVDVYLACD